MGLLLQQLGHQRNEHWRELLLLELDALLITNHFHLQTIISLYPMRPALCLPALDPYLASTLPL